MYLFNGQIFTSQLSHPSALIEGPRGEKGKDGISGKDGEQPFRSN